MPARSMPADLPDTVSTIPRRDLSFQVCPRNGSAIVHRSTVAGADADNPRRPCSMAPPEPRSTAQDRDIDGANFPTLLLEMDKAVRAGRWQHRVFVFAVHCQSGQRKFFRYTESTM